MTRSLPADSYPSADDETTRPGSAESLAAFDWNRWPPSFGVAGRNRRNPHWIIDRAFGTWDFGYVTTSHASQGKTVDRVFIAESTLSRGAASAEQLYVSASRARREVRLFTDDRQALRAMIVRSSARRHALDLLRGRGIETPSPTGPAAQV